MQKLKFYYFISDPEELEPLHHHEEEELEDDEAEGDEDEEDYEWLDNKNTFHPDPEILTFDKKKPRKDGLDDHETTLRWWESVVTKPAGGGGFDHFGSTTALPFGIKKEPQGNGDQLPVFVVHPADAFIIRGKPAVLECKVIGADKVI